MKEPFDNMYYYDNIQTNIINRPSFDKGNFPNNVAYWYWSHEGEKDQESWMCFVRLTNGNYAFLRHIVVTPGLMLRVV
jgi:hypothetical protein